MGCLYTYNGQTYTYRLLIDIIQGLEALINLDGYSYYLYSKDIDAKSATISKIKSAEASPEILEKLKGVKLKFTEAGEEIGLQDTDKGKLEHVLTYLNSSEFVDDNNNPYLSQLSEETLRQSLINKFKTEFPDISDTDLNNRVEDEIKFYRLQAIHGYILHNLYNQDLRSYAPIGGEPEDARGKVRDRLSKIAELHPDNQDLKAEIEYLLGSNSFINSFLNLIHSESLRPTRPLGSTVLYNTTLAKLITTPSGQVKTLYDRIDLIVIDTDGTVHVYRIKASADQTSFWQNPEQSASKVERYRYELALVKSMLKDAGIKSSKIQLHLITMETLYEGHKLITVAPLANILQMDLHNSKNVMGKHQKAADSVIKPTENLEFVSEALTRANKVLSRVWPESGIKSSLLFNSAELWIMDHRHYIHSSSTDGYSWEFTFNGDVIKIKEDSPIDSNVELKNKILQLLAERNSNSQDVVDALQSSITLAFKTGTLTLTDAFKGCRDRIQSVFDLYLNDVEIVDDKPHCRWHVISSDELFDSGIILLEHEKTHRLDVITLTDLNIRANYTFKNDPTRTYLSGALVPDLSSEGLDKATVGNMILTRALITLNELIPQLNIGAVLLGEISVISTLGHGDHFERNIGIFNSTLLSKLLLLAYKNSPEDGQIINNISGCKNIDYVTLLVDSLLYSLGHDSYTALKPYEEKLKNLKNLSNDSAKIDLLLEIAKDFMYNTGYEGKSLSEINDNFISGQPSAKLLMKIMNALNNLQKLDVHTAKRIGSLTKFFIRTSYIPSANFKVILRMYNARSQVINDLAFDIGLEISKACESYYKACGYSDLENILIGDQTRTFKRLYKLAGDGTLSAIMELKNPWDSSNDLLLYERDFLKKVIFIFTKFRFRNLGLEFNFTSADLSAFTDYVKTNISWILTIPLMKASTSSAMQTGYYFKLKFDDLRRMITDPLTYSKEILDESAISEAIAQRRLHDSVWMASVYNHFDIAEPEIASDAPVTGRSRVIDNHKEDPRYFETNLENLLRDFTMEAIRSLEMRKLMAGAKMFSLAMYLQGKNNPSEGDYSSELQYIDDFLKVAVLGLPLIESDNVRIAHNISKARLVVSQLFIAGNVASAIRDSLEGFSLIMIKALTKHNAEFSVAEVSKAYMIVTKEMVSNMNTANILSQICIKYRLSNIDVSKVSEGMKSAKSGIFHFQEVMYKTLKTPDFLNRMVYFVSKALHDGVYDAFSLKDGNLVYNWKFDKRFNLLATGNKTDLEAYNKLRGLLNYYQTKWNEEHPNRQIKIGGEELPMPYSDSEMKIEHEKADAIWGAYDKAEKSLGEHMLVGMTFGMFMTWMNGLITQYFAETQPSSTRFQLKQMVDDATGLPLWYDENNIPTTENTGIPVYTEVPLMVLGIWQTLKLMWTVLNTPGLSLKENVFSELLNVDNMKKLVTDAVVTVIYFALIKALLAAMRDKQKEVVDPHDLITNCICEVLYKGMYNSWDGFTGPIAIINYLGSETNPPFYTESVLLAKDLFRTTFGDMTILSFGAHHLAPLRSIKNSLKAYETGKHPF